MKTMTRLMAAAAVCLLSAGADAAVTFDVRNGVLLGASGIDIGGRSYDVSFADGSCNTLFGGCASSTFAFRTEAGARIAARALLDQVFVGRFAERPDFTNGCTTSDGVCTAYIPFAVANDLDPDIFDDDVVVIAATNPLHSLSNAIGRSNLAFDRDVAGDSTRTYARFSPTAAVAAVPEPAGWALMLTGFGLTGAALRRRRVRFARVPA